MTDTAPFGETRWHEDHFLVTSLEESFGGKYAWIEDGASVLRYPRKRSSGRRDRSQREISDLFADYARRWRDETAFVSSHSEKVLHPSYQRIIGLGWLALPNIFFEMRARGGDWFWALTSIVGYDVAEGAETFSEAVSRWEAWADERGLAD